MPSIARTGLAAAAFGLVAALALPQANAGEPATGAAGNWAAVEKCAALSQDDARHACTDEVLRRAGLLGAHGSAPKAPAGSGAQSAAPRTDFGLQTPPREASKPRTADRLDVTLASVEQSGDGKLVLTTTDGAVWRQVESDPVRLPPARGQTLVIERTLFGGFMCKSGRWVAFRCRRVR